MVIADEDIDEVKRQYDELMLQSKEIYPGTGDLFLHISIIDWLNKEFDPDYKPEE